MWDFSGSRRRQVARGGVPATAIATGVLVCGRGEITGGVPLHGEVGLGVAATHQHSSLIVGSRSLLGRLKGLQSHFMARVLRTPYQH
uniref:Uncharacterized protein n=1 Tax=Oryza rufipogon TaxID=4529 RepID=A0A0E0NY06_ORYRU